jgi:hypothetical protein
MRRIVYLVAFLALMVGFAAVPAAAANRRPAPPRPTPAPAPAPRWTYDAPIGPNPASSAASCPTSGTTGNTVASTVDHLALSGTGNEAPTINGAIGALEPKGGEVLLPGGTWTIDSAIDVTSNVTLAGGGEGVTTLKAGSTFLGSTGPLGGNPMVYVSDATNVTVEDLTLDQQGQTLSGNGAGGRLNEMILSDESSTNVLFYNVETEDPFSYSIGELYSEQFCFSGDTTQVNTSGLYSQLDGIHLHNGSDGDVTNDFADQCHGSDGDDAIALQAWGGSVSKINISGDTTCSAGANALRLAETDTGDSIFNVQADGNVFENSPGGVSTGYFPNGGSISDVAIEHNEFSGVTLSPGVEILAPPGGTVTDTLVEDNCGAATWELVSGTGNVNTGNTASCA